MASQIFLTSSTSRTAGTNSTWNQIKSLSSKWNLLKNNHYWNHHHSMCMCKTWDDGKDNQWVKNCGYFSIINWVDNINWPLWRVSKLMFRVLANAQNVNFETLYNGQFMSSTLLLILNYLVILSHQCSTSFLRNFLPLFICKELSGLLRQTCKSHPRTRGVIYGTLDLTYHCLDHSLNTQLLVQIS